MKQLSRKQIEARKRQAVRFVHDVLADPERADEIAEESLEDYAARRKIQILNPTRRGTMPRKTIEDYRAEVADLKDEIAELQDENEALEDQLDEVAAIVSPEEEEDGGDQEDDESGE